MNKKQILLLGSTGTIGDSTLDLVDRYPDRFEVVGLAAGRNVTKLAEQVRKFRPKSVAILNPEDEKELRSALGNSLCKGLEVFSGDGGATELTRSMRADLVVSAIVGFAGVAPTLAAIENGMDVALANKEAIVAAGPIIKSALEERQSQLIPVDSEHSAIHQALYGSNSLKSLGVRKLILTSSGGPFREWSLRDLENVTVEQALNHPTWNMGAKITIDSSTMMNKGLEVIEASRLFDVPVSDVEVLVHPESIIHSMIEFTDGAMLAQLGVTDMRGPISYAMAHPDRLEDALPRLNLAEVGKLTFFAADFAKFPCLRLAYEAVNMGDSAPCVLNAANEVAVEGFLNRKIGYIDIARIVEKTLEKHTACEISTLEEVVNLDHWARAEATSLLQSKRGLSAHSV